REGAPYLEDIVHQFIQRSILQTPLETLGERSSNGRSYNNVVGVLCKTIYPISLWISPLLRQQDTHIASRPCGFLKWDRIDDRRSWAIMKGYYEGRLGFFYV